MISLSRKPLSFGMPAAAAVEVSDRTNIPRLRGFLSQGRVLMAGDWIPMRIDLYEDPFVVVAYRADWGNV